MQLSPFNLVTYVTSSKLRLHLSSSLLSLKWLGNIKLFNFPLFLSPCFFFSIELSLENIIDLVGSNISSTASCSMAATHSCRCSSLLAFAVVVATLKNFLFSLFSSLSSASFSLKNSVSCGVSCPGVAPSFSDGSLLLLLGGVSILGKKILELTPRAQCKSQCAADGDMSVIELLLKFQRFGFTLWQVLPNLRWHPSLQPQLRSGVPSSLLSQTCMFPPMHLTYSRLQDLEQ